MQGLHDYRVLKNEWITNKEFRQFFNVDNDDNVNKLFKRLNLQYEGKTKGRRYLILENIWMKELGSSKNMRIL